MFNRFDQAELPVTDAFGMPFSTLRKRQVEEAMPEVQLRPNDPAILAANQTTDFGMPIPEPEPRRPFVPVQQPPNPIANLRPLSGAGGGGATTRQDVPDDILDDYDNNGGDRQNGQSINPLSSIALSKLQDFEAQGVPQQNPKLWQKLLALAAGAGSVVAAMNAERVRPDTQALAGMTNSILYPNEERNRARWLDQRALLRDAVRTEQTGNENVLEQMKLAQKAKVDQATINKLGAQAGMYASKEDTNRANTELAKWKQDIGNIIPKTTEELKTRQLWEASKSPDPKVRAAADAELTKLYETKIAKPKRTSVMDAEVAALTDEIMKSAAANGVQLDRTEAREQALVKWGERSAELKAKQAAAGLENKAASTERLKRPPASNTGGRGRQQTPEQQLNAAASKIAEDALATTSKDGVYDGAAAAKAVNAITDLPPEVKNRALKLVNAKIRSGGNSSMDNVNEFLVNMGGGGGNKAVAVPPKPTTPTPNAPPKPGTKTIIRYGKDGNPIY